jgi:hypothetical protein
MAIEIQEAQMINLLHAIHQSPNGVLSTEEATAVVGAENVETLRSLMDQQKLLMPPSGGNKGGFELTFAGLRIVGDSYAAEVLAEGSELTEETLLEMMLRGKRELGLPVVWDKKEPLKITAPEQSGARAFLLPENDRKLFVELVQAIPTKWSWMDGRLKAPQDLVEAGQASAHAGIKIEEYNHDLLVSERDERQPGRSWSNTEYEPMIAQVREDLLDILAQHRIPGFVTFYHAGFDSKNSSINFDSVLKIALAHLGFGYTGWLDFYSGCYDNHPQGPEEVEMHLEPWVDNDFGIRTPRPPMIQILWKPKHGGGKFENVAGLVEICRTKELEEIPIKITCSSRW